MRTAGQQQDEQVAEQGRLLDEALHEANERARWLARFPDENPSPVARVSANGMVLYLNPAAARLPGWNYPPGQPLPDPLLSLVKLAMAQGQEMQQDVQLADRFYSVSVMPFPDERYANLYGRDITERKRAEQALLESEERYRNFFDHLYETVSIFEAVRDEQGNITDWVYLDVNQAGLQILGMPREKVVGQPVSQVLGVEVLTRFTVLYREVLDTGKPFHHDTAYRDQHFLVSVSRMDENRVASIGLDITERKQAERELRENEEKLRLYADKLKDSNRELQEFAYVASHDLQEPLRKIESFGELLLESAPELDDRGRNYVERMRKAAGRLRGMVDGLLQLSRVNTQGQPFIPVDLSRVAGEVLSDLEQQVRRTGGKVEVGDLPEVEGDPLQLRLLLQNLIGNALKYHRPGVPPVVKVYSQGTCDRGTGISDQGLGTRNEPSVPDHLSLVTVIIEDNGIGFDESQVERMFQPFQRLVGRNEYEGSGMGLAICRKIVERHGGVITACSEPGKGTRFIVNLPAS